MDFKTEEDLMDAIPELKQSVLKIEGTLNLPKNMEVRNIKRSPVWLSDKFEYFGVLRRNIKKNRKKFEYTGKLYKNGKYTGEMVEIWANNFDDFKKQLKKQYKS